MVFLMLRPQEFLVPQVTLIPRKAKASVHLPPLVCSQAASLET